MLEILETPLTGLHIFAAVVLIMIILIQPGKSGGLTAALGGSGSQQVFGGRGAGNFLTRGTWGLAITFFFTSMILAYASSSTDDSIRDPKKPKAALEEKAEKTDKTEKSEKPADAPKP